MIGRQDLDECPKCHNTLIRWQPLEAQGDTVRYSVGFCDCPTANRYLKDIYASFALKARAGLVVRDIVERMAQLQKPQ